MEQYYSNKKLLSLLDKDRRKPEIYICDGNRTAGKSFAFKSTCLNYFFNTQDTEEKEFMLLYRNKYEIKDAHEKFFTDIEFKYPGHVMTSEKMFDGLLYRLLLDDMPCGFAVALTSAAKLKTVSSVFVNVSSMFFDEYQNEDDAYLPNEVDKLISIHTSVARGHGKQTRYVPLYMCSNCVTILNPYYSAFGINKMLKFDTKFLRGEGWVFEKTYNENAAKAFEESAFNRAFKNSGYFKHASQNVYLNDSKTLIGKPSGGSRYFLSIKYNGEWYCARRYDDCMYIDTGCDIGYPLRVCFNVDDVTDDRAVMINRYDPSVDVLRSWFNAGKMRFKNIKCKSMALDLLSYV